MKYKLTCFFVFFYPLICHPSEASIIVGASYFVNRMSGAFPLVDYFDSAGKLLITHYQPVFMYEKDQYQLLDPAAEKPIVRSCRITKKASEVSITFFDSKNRKITRWPYDSSSKKAIMPRKKKISIQNTDSFRKLPSEETGLNLESVIFELSS